MTSNERWTPHEDARAAKLRSEGLDSNEIGKVLQRSSDSVRRRFNHLGKTDEQRASDLAVKRKQKQLRRAKVAEHSSGLYVPRQIVPDHVLDERHERLGINHTTITGWMMGDPLPGRSALDQRSR